MKRRFTEEQIIGILSEAEAGVKVKNICRQHNVTHQTRHPRNPLIIKSL